ncbi:packaging protein [Gokushovirinae Bog5712_52]|uniref:packaging protein n=1 Tax=Gokushovirinae Bog5712_52 TaxID=1655649 RepID=UPI00063D5663|nr:packaging protein [Gokushovirinae Bog5712_52]AKI26887.1 packaging protein [Gokushovirinae Bog5712_52]
MKLAIYSLFDRAVGVYGRPMFAPAYGAVLRDLKRAVNENSQDNLVMHAADFDLVFCGTFEDSSCVFSLLPVPELKINCGALRHAVEVPPSTGAFDS